MKFDMMHQEDKEAEEREDLSMSLLTTHINDDNESKALEDLSYNETLNIEINNDLHEELIPADNIL